MSPFFKKPEQYLYGLEPKKVSRYFDDRLTLCFIDIGVKNLGFVVFSIDRHWNRPSLVYLERVDLTRLGRYITPHTSNELSDRVDRFSALYDDYLSPCDRIFIERQPLAGIKACEQLLFKKYRDKATLISPNSVHSFFRYGSRQGFDYGARKRYATAAADEVIRDCATDKMKERWNRMDLEDEKRDDIGDPIVMAMYVIEKKRQEWREYFSE